MTQINSLILEPEKLMSAIRDEWIKVAFDTSPINKEKAEVVINLWGEEEYLAIAK
jgi:hypothetical protein